jgi:hypothetical protein
MIRRRHIAIYIEGGHIAPYHIVHIVFHTAWLDWDRQQEQAIEQQVEAELVAAGGYGGNSRRGVGHIHAQIETERRVETQQYRFRY